MAGGVCGAGAPDGPLREGAAGGRVCQGLAAGGVGACQHGRPGAGHRATDAGHRPHLCGARVPQDDRQGKLLPSLKLIFSSHTLHTQGKKRISAADNYQVRIFKEGRKRSL